MSPINVEIIKKVPSVDDEVVDDRSFSNIKSLEDYIKETEETSNVKVISYTINEDD